MPAFIRFGSLLCLATLMATGAFSRDVRAQVGSDRYASLVMDANSGAVLSQINADEYRFPASLTKMMTLYILFEAVRDRRINLNEPVPVSANAASMSPTKLGLVPGTYITVEQALLGLVTKSANDAACALGEMMGGDEERFAQIMTLRARALGMSHTTFRNASGLPDWSQVTTARDMALLARHLIQDFPGYYRYFSVPSFVFQGRTVLNHQRLLQTYPGADGLKTGYTEAAGYNVVTSAVHGETRLIGVVLGASSGVERDQHMAMLLDQGFDREGAPMAPLMARREPSWNRMAGLLAAAQAAQAAQPLPPSVSAPQYAQAPYPAPPMTMPRAFHPRPAPVFVPVVVPAPVPAAPARRLPRHNETRYSEPEYRPAHRLTEPRGAVHERAARAGSALPLPPVHVIHPTRTAETRAAHGRG